MSYYLSTDNIENLLYRYKGKGVVIDTNLLLLILIGIFDKKRISKHKRLQKFSEEDFVFLDQFSKFIGKVVITPQILAELTNFIDISRDEEQEMFSAITNLIERAKEKYYAKDFLLNENLLPRIGFTDMSILASARKRKTLVLTEDLPLTEALCREGCDVINFNDIRTQKWLYDKQSS